MDECPTAQNIQLAFEPGMTTGQLFWQGDLLANGWIFLIGYQGLIDIIVFLSNRNSKNAELDLSMLSPGVYVMKVQLSGKIRSYQLLKK